MLWQGCRCVFLLKLSLVENNVRQLCQAEAIFAIAALKQLLEMQAMVSYNSTW